LFASSSNNLLSDGVATFTPGISERRSNTTRWLHSGAANADTLTLSSQGVDATRDYDAFGNELGSTGTWQGPFGYAAAYGYQDDSDFGLKLLGERYYDSSTGAFLSRDGARATRNHYAYSEGNPNRYVDFDGLKPKLIILIGDMGTKGGDNDLRSSIARCINKMKELFEKDYDIEIRCCRTIEDFEEAVIDADALIYVGHGSPSTQKKRNIRVSDIIEARKRRTKAGKGDLDFIRLYSCACITNKDEEDAWLALSPHVLGWGGNCYPGRENPDKGGAWRHRPGPEGVVSWGGGSRSGGGRI
jgi:RHS repeat-associated protein